MGVVKELLENARKILAQMSSTQRASVLTMLITVASLLILIVWLGSLGEKSLNVPINIEVPLAQVDNIREILSKGGVSQIDYDQKAQMILVPEPERAKALILLAKAQLLPSNSKGGFEEALKNTKFTDTKEVAGVRFRTALQEEVSAMIQSIEGVDRARVIYAEAETRQLFRTPARQRATISVAMAYNRPLAQDLADTIISLVAFAKSGLEERDVIVSDQDGRHFTKDAEDNVGRIAVKAIEMNRISSNRVKKDIEELVRRSIPNSESYVWVDTTWDLSKQKITEDTLVAAMPARINTRKITDRHTDEPGQVVGTQPNVRRTANVQSEGTGRRISRDYERAEKDIQNAFSTKKTELIPAPKIEKQTISVVVHLPYEYRHIDNDPTKGWAMETKEDILAADPNASGNEQLRKQFPAPELKGEDLLNLENAIRKASGMLDGEGSREVMITQIPWRPALETDKRKEIVDHWKEFFASNAIPLILMSILLIAMVFLYLQAKRSLPSDEVELPDLSDIGAGGTKPFTDQDRNQADFENLRNQIGDIIDEDPSKATTIVRRWMNARDG